MVKTMNEHSNPIEAVVTDCVCYWVLKGLPRARIDEMEAELRQHLTAAVNDGKSLDTVIGDDLRTFAEDWAEAVREPKPVRYRMLNWAYVLFVSLIPVLLEVIIDAHSLTVPIYLGTLLLYAIMVLVPSVLFALPISPRLWLEKAPGARRVVGIGLIAMVVVAVCTYSLTTVLSRSPLFYLPAPATVALFVGAGVVCRGAVKRDPTAPKAAQNIVDKVVPHVSRRSAMTAAVLTIGLTVSLYGWLNTTAGIIHSLAETGVYCFGLILYVWFLTR